SHAWLSILIRSGRVNGWLPFCGAQDAKNRRGRACGRKSSVCDRRSVKALLYSTTETKACGSAATFRLMLSNSDRPSPSQGGSLMQQRFTEAIFSKAWVLIVTSTPSRNG